MRKLLGLIAGLALLGASVGWSQDTPAEASDLGNPVLMRALGDELQRSLEGLVLEDLERPYFIAYRVEEVRGHNAAASGGGLLSSRTTHTRFLTVELRVGSPELDNTNFLVAPSFSRSMLGNPLGVTDLPLDDDYLELRRQIWLATDTAYKQAVEHLSQKRAALKTRSRADELPDFRPLGARRYDADGPWLEVDLGHLEDTARELSRALTVPEIYTSRVDFQASTIRVHYLDSEGAAYVRTTPRVSLVALAGSQAEDGTRLGDHARFYGRSLAELPSRDELLQAMEALATRLAARRTAPGLERFNGPVLFTGDAAADVFGQVFAPALLAQRRPVAGDERMAAMLNAGGSTGSDFTDRLGGRVLPRGMTVTDDPSRDTLGDQGLVGGVVVDDQGRPTGKTTVIERGYLRTLLTDRNPVEGIEQATANRLGGGILPTNLIVESSAGLEPQALHDELLSLVADRGGEFGILVERLVDATALQGLDPTNRRVFRIGAGAGGGTTLALAEATKVYPDGRREALGVVEIVGLEASGFKELVAVGDVPNVLHRTMRPPRSAMGMRTFLRSQGSLVSLAVPDLLFEELTVKTPTGEIPRPPTYEAPSTP